MQEALQQLVGRAVPAAPHAKMRVILETQRAAFLRAGTPSLEERRADLAKLAGAIRHESGRIAEVISRFPVIARATTRHLSVAFCVVGTR